MNPFLWLLSRLSPVPKLGMDAVKHSAPDRPELRRQTFTGLADRHRMTGKRAPLTLRKRDVA